MTGVLTRSSRVVRSLKRARRSGSFTPKIVRRITSSVMRCMDGRSGNARPSGHVATSRSAASRIASV